MKMMTMRWLSVFLLFFCASLAPLASAKVPTPPILIFVSSSMPKISLVQWMRQARTFHAALILRGFVNGSLSNTRRFAQTIIAESGGTGGFSIDPLAFKAFHIQQVPAVVVTSMPFHCNQENCTTGKFEVVYGNVSLATALQTIAEQQES